MNKVLFPKKDYVKELGRIFKSSKNSQKLIKTLSKYHEKDIAEAITLLTPAERQNIYNVLDEHLIAEIFSYLDDAEKYLEELSLEKAARVVSYMDSDDAVDVLDELAYAAGIEHDVLLLLALASVLGGYLQPGVQKSLLPHSGVQDVVVENRLLEHLRVRMEAHHGARVVSLSHHGHRLSGLPAGELHLVYLPVLVHGDLQPVG